MPFEWIPHVRALPSQELASFFATACVGQVGVHIWNNKTLFTHVPTRQISEQEIAEMHAPTVSGEGGRGLIDEAFVNDVDDSTEVPLASTPDQLSADMMTLSLVPKSRWQTLLHLDLIKQRNKPTEAPKLPEKAPFFLPSLEKPHAAPAVNEEKPGDALAERSRIMKMDRLASEGAFTVALRLGSENGDYDAFIDHLKTLSPSAADLEIRSLNPGEGDVTSDELVNFVQALTSRLSQKRDYELVQAWMTVFLRLHSESIAHDERLISALRIWRQHQESEGLRLGDLVGYCNGVIAFMRSPRT